MKITRRSWLKRAAIAAAISGVALLLLGATVVAAFVLIYGLDSNETQRVSGGGEQVVSITLTDFDVTPGTLLVDRGTHVVLDVANRGDSGHNLAVEGGVHSKQLTSGESQRLDLGVISGPMDMVCTQRLHEFLGMKLHIKVTQ